MNHLELLRKQLDVRLNRERRLVLEAPRDGWIKTIRSALGMTLVQLGKRLGVSKQAVVNYEKAEVDGSITVNTLAKIADALECDVKLVLVPKKSLKQIIKDRAYQLAANIVKRSSLHMELEAQGTSAAFKKSEVRKIAEELIRSPKKKLWEEV